MVDMRVENKKILAEIGVATGASEEDIKAMLQLHDGDANAAMIALLENPFQKVDAKKHKQPDSGSSRERPAPRPRDVYPASSGRSGAPRSSRPEGRGGAGSRGGGPSTSTTATGRVPRPSSRETPSSTLTPKTDNGYERTAFPEEDLGSGHDAETTSAAASAPAAAGGAWGSTSSTTAATAPSAGAWGAGAKTMAERIKAKQAPAPPVPTYKPSQASPLDTETAAPSYAYPAGEYTEDGDEGGYEPAEAEILTAPEDEASEDVAQQVEEPAAAQTYQASWSNADAAKNLLNSLTSKANATAAAQSPSPAPVQQAVPQAQQQPDQCLSAADNAIPSSAHYAAYGAAGAPTKIPTAAEIEALQMTSVNFGNFNLGDFSANFNPGPSYAAAPSDPKPMPAAEPAPVPVPQDAYNGYGSYATAEQLTNPSPAAPTQSAPHASTAAPDSFSTFGQAGSGAFSAAFSSNFSAPSHDPSYEAFASYGQEALKQSYGNAPGMAAYNMQQYQQQQQLQQQLQQQQQQQQQPASYNQSVGSGRSMYSTPYMAAAPQQPAAAAPAPEATAAASNASNPSAPGAAPSGMPAGAVGAPHQMHFSAPQAAAAPGMGQYNAALYNQQQQQQQYAQFAPPPYMGQYNAMGQFNMSYPYQGVGAYPPQATAGYPNANAAYSVPQHAAGPRAQQQQYNPYSNPAQAGAPGLAGAPAGYAAAGQQAAYGLTGYEDMASSAAGAANGSYGAGGGKDKDTNIYGGQQGVYQSQQGAVYQGQGQRGGYGGGGYANPGYSGGQSYNQQPKGNYGGGGYNNRQQHNQQQQQQYGGPGGPGYNKGL